MVVVVLCVCVCCGGGQDGCLTDQYQEENPGGQDEWDNGRMTTVLESGTRDVTHRETKDRNQVEIVNLRRFWDGSGGNIR